MVQFAGVLLIFGSIIGGIALTRGRRKAAWKPAVAFASMGVLAGIVMILQERATEISIAGVGKIKAAAAQATKDASEVAELRSRIERHSRELEESVAKVGQLEAALETAMRLTKELEARSAFEATVMAAEHDDRPSFDELARIAADKTSPLANAAEAAWISVLDRHAQPMYASGFSVSWKPGVDPAKLDLRALEKAYKEAPIAMRVGLIEYIWNRADIGKADRMEFLVSVIRTDSSLRAVEYAGRFYSDASGLKLKPLAADHFVLDWNAKEATYRTARN